MENHYHNIKSGRCRGKVSLGIKFLFHCSSSVIILKYTTSLWDFCCTSLDILSITDKQQVVMFSCTNILPKLHRIRFSCACMILASVILGSSFENKSRMKASVTPGLDRSADSNADLSSSMASVR